MNLLINEPPLQVLPTLAKTLGLNNALLIQQVHYWLRVSSNNRDGHKWVYKTVDEWNYEFPFWSKSTIERIIKNLVDQELLIIGNYNRMKMDRTKWYRIDYENLDKHCCDAFRQNDVMHSVKMTSSIPSNCGDAIRQNDENHSVNLTVPITREYTENTTENTSEIIDDDKQGSKIEIEPANQNRITAFSFYESNGFGMISGHVVEKINYWIEDMNEELVIHAMQLAVENNALRWNYVETILKNWVNKKIKSLADVEAERLRYEQQKNQQKGGFQKQGRRVEHVPEYLFANRNQPQKEQRSDIDIEEERKKILKKLGRAE